MYVVFSENRLTLIGNEYYGISPDKTKIISYHNPNLADHFSSIEDAIEFSNLFNCPVTGSKCSVELLSTHKELFEKCSYEFRTLPFLNTKYNIPYDNKKHNKKDVLDWHINFQKLPENSITFENYSTWPQPYQVCDHIFSLETFESKKFSASIYTGKNGDYSKFHSELKLVLDYCTMLDSEGRKMFSIFDHDLSSNGTRRLCYLDENNCSIITNSIHYNGTLEECFNIIRRKYYYE